LNEVTLYKLERNDPNKTSIFFFDDVAEYGRRLGRALVGNTYVSELNLNLMDDTGNPDVENIQLVLQYLREGTAFRTLWIWGGVRDYTGPCVTAISQNPNTFSLNMGDGIQGVPEAEVANLLRTSQTLREIYMPMVNSIAIAEAFEVNQTLTSITLIFNPISFPAPNGIILRHLIAHRPPCRLTISQITERIGSGTEAMAVDDALSACLAGATWLNELRLIGITFTRSRTQQFLEALRSNRSIEKLCFVSCDFDQETVSVVRDFTHLPTYGFASSTIHEICVEEQFEPLSEELVALFVLGIPGLQVLDWRWPTDPTLTIDLFWNMLADRASLVRLSVLRIEFWPGVTRREMNDCLPLLPSLRELHFRSTQEYERWEPQTFLDTAMKCSSLRDITLDNALPRFWSEKEARLARALFQRNHLLYQLVSMPWLGQVVQDAEDFVETGLFPSLFFAAKRSAGVAPNSILTGLLALSDAIGFLSM
jgi:hypothetical protein